MLNKYIVKYSQMFESHGQMVHQTSIQWFFWGCLRWSRHVLNRQPPDMNRWPTPNNNNNKNNNNKNKGSHNWTTLNHQRGKGNAAAKALKRWHQTQFVTPTWEYNGQAHEYYAYELRCVQYILHCIHMHLYPHVSNVSTHLGQRCIINGIIESAMQLYLFVCMCFRSFQVTHSNLTPRRQSFHRQAEIRKWSGEGIQ